MPHVVEVPWSLTFVSNEGPGIIRPTGPHLTPIIRDLEQTLYPQKHKSSPEGPGRENAYPEMGWIFERLVEKEFRARQVAQHHVFQIKAELDGIHGSPDAVRILDTGRIKGVEFKATWRNAKYADNLEDEFWSWMVQMGGYAQMLDVLEFELYAYFVNGYYEYRKQGPPCVRKWEVKWTELERDKMWRMIVSHKARMLREGRLTPA